MEDEKIKQKNPNKQVEEAKQKLEAGDSSKAEDILKKVLLEIDQKFEVAAEAAYQLRKLFENKIEIFQAKKHYERAFQLQTDNSNYLNQIGLSEIILGNFEKAIEYYEKALKSDLATFGENHPNIATDWNNLGGSWVSKGQYDKAMEYYQKALAIFEETKLVHMSDVVKGNIEALKEELGKES